MIDKQDDAFMKRHPSRDEVAKFVKAVMDNTYLPLMRQYASNAAKEALNIMQSMLLDCGVLTDEQCKDFVKKCLVMFGEKRKQETEEHNGKTGSD